MLGGHAAAGRAGGRRGLTDGSVWLRGERVLWIGDFGRVRLGFGEDFSCENIFARHSLTPQENIELTTSDGDGVLLPGGRLLRDDLRRIGALLVAGAALLPDLVQPRVLPTL